MQPKKKQVEILLFQYFRECYNDFPSGKVTASESPDFIVALKSKNHIGIELTRLNPLNARALDEEELTSNKLKEQIIFDTKIHFENRSPLKLFVKFLFSDNLYITEERVFALSIRLARIIYQQVEDRRGDYFFREMIDEEKLPEGLSSILIIHHPGLEESVWERSNNLGISEDVIADLHDTIRKKDDKLRLYQKQHLNYYWLLIFTDRLRGAKNLNLGNLIMNHTFSSGFQHIFLFDLLKSEVFQLV